MTPTPSDAELLKLCEQALNDDTTTHAYKFAVRLKSLLSAPLEGEIAEIEKRERVSRALGSIKMLREGCDAWHAMQDRATLLSHLRSRPVASGQAEGVTREQIESSVLAIMLCHTGDITDQAAFDEYHKDLVDIVTALTRSPVKDAAQAPVLTEEDEKEIRLARLLIKNWDRSVLADCMRNILAIIDRLTKQAPVQPEVKP